MRAGWLGLGLLWCAAAAADISYEGEARDPANGQLLYQEQHLLRGDDAGPDERLVLYRCASGALFARKRVVYGAQRAAPEFLLEDGRFGYREGVRRERGALLAFARGDADSAERSAEIAHSAQLVIDAGFDEFVRAQWDDLMRGRTIGVDFVVPSRLDALRFKLRRVDATEIEGEAASVFRLSLGGLIGWFAPDIDVSYRDRDRRLMRFEGLTTIRADRDDNLVARIEFPIARSRSGVDPMLWDAAQREPLGACRPGS
jgi:hypothetical protein